MLGRVLAMLLQPGPAKLRARREQAALRERSAGAACRTLRNHGERERLAKAHLIRRLAEIEAARGADSLDVSAERHSVEVSLEQFPLRVARLQPERRSDLTQLAGRRLRVQPVGESGQLHRQRRTALAPAAAVGADRGANERDRIHAGVPVERAIFFQQERVDEHRRYLRQRSPQPVLIVC
jgi:hypothetical protein